jgi:hypothetical protein
MLSEGAPESYGLRSGCQPVVFRRTGGQRDPRITIALPIALLRPQRPGWLPDATATAGRANAKIVMSGGTRRFGVVSP